jgi:hypothetical protein
VQSKVRAKKRRNVQDLAVVLGEWWEDKFLPCFVLGKPLHLIFRLRSPFDKRLLLRFLLPLQPCSLLCVVGEFVSILTI